MHKKQKRFTLFYYCDILKVMEKLVVASSNAGKLKEIAKMTEGIFTVGSMAAEGYTEEIEETGETFLENAVLKAKAVSEVLGVTALADDSGLVVDCLGGAPGVYSARYSGEPCDNARNRALLLKNMQGCADRSARFVSCIAVCFPDGRVITAEGETEGYILESEEGDNGFGYDCLFFSKDLNKSFGVASDEEKNSVSHRGRALKAIVEKLKCNV